MHDFLSYFRGIDPDLRHLILQALRIVAIVVAAWVLHALARHFIRAFRSYMERRVEGVDDLARINTLSRVFRNVATVVIVVVAGMLVLNELGISIAPILATAGVAGIAIGFGAQSLIKDYFNGMFLLLDDQIRVGDVVEIAGKGGLVEEVTLRFVKLRDLDSHVHFVPCGEINVVTNRTRTFATPLIELRLAMREDPDEAFALMKEVAAGMRAESKWGALITDELEIIGFDRWSESAAVLRVRLRVVPPIEQWSVKREFQKRLQKAFAERGIEIALPHLTIFPGQRKDGSAPPLQVVARSSG